MPGPAVGICLLELLKIWSDQIASVEVDAEAKGKEGRKKSQGPWWPFFSKGISAPRSYLNSFLCPRIS